MKFTPTHGATAAWSPLVPSDAAAVKRIAQTIHADLFERTEVLFDKVSRFPQGCRKLIKGGVTLGYAIAHPWFLNEIPDLDAFLPKRTDPPDCLFIHDVAVLPEARGSGVAEAYVALLRPIAAARGVRYLACVSVYGTDRLWSRFGFTAVNTPGVAAQILKYGPTAKYMAALASG